MPGQKPSASLIAFPRTDASLRTAHPTRSNTCPIPETRSFSVENPQRPAVLQSESSETQQSEDGPDEVYSGLSTRPSEPNFGYGSISGWSNLSLASLSGDSIDPRDSISNQDSQGSANSDTPRRRRIPRSIPPPPEISFQHPQNPRPQNQRNEHKTRPTIVPPSVSIRSSPTYHPLNPKNLHPSTS